MFRLLIPLITGIILYDCFPAAIPAVPALLMLLAVFMVMLLVSNGVRRQKRCRTWCLCSGQLFLLLSGYLVYRLADTGMDSDLIRGRYDYTLAVAAAAPVKGRNSTRLLVQLAGKGKGRHFTAAKGKAFLYLPPVTASCSYEPGDTLLLPARWQPISNSGNPYEFNYSRYCRRRNIRYRQYVSPESILLRSKSKLRIPYTERCHRYCLSSIRNYIHDTVTAALLQAVITGDESDIDPETRQAYADTGIIHIVSVSGAHVNLLFIALAFLLRFIRQRRLQWIQFVLSCILVWFYVLMAGAAAPAIRAALMFTILAAGILLQRSAPPLNQLCAAAFLMLLFQPQWLFSAGFQLSFLAILSLLLFYRPVYSLLKPSGRLSRWLWEGVALSIAAEILTASLVVFYFHNFPFTFLAANLIASLVMGALLLLGAVMVLLAAVPLLAAFLATVLTYISHVFHYCIFLLQDCSPPFFSELQLDAGNLVLLYIFIAALSVYLAGKQRQWLWTSVAAISLFGVSVLYINWSAARQRIFIVYNNRMLQAEVLEGYRYKVLAGDSNSFAGAHAHMGYRCTRYGGKTDNNWLVTGGKRILLADRETAVTTLFPADIVVLQPPFSSADIVQICRNHRPELIVLGGGISTAQAFRVQQQCDSLHIRVHHTRRSGAFVFPDQ